MAETVYVKNSPENAVKVDSIGVVGSQFQVTLKSSVSAADPASATAGEVWTSSAGFKYATVTAVTTIASGDRVVIRFDTNSSTDLETACSDIHAAFTTATETEYPNTIILSINKSSDTIKWDGSTTIKKVVVSGSNATAVRISMEAIS